jgi:WD40 repeat protein
MAGDDPAATAPELAETRDSDEVPAAPTGEALPTVDPAHYAVGDEFSHGGIGRLLRAHDRRLGRVVAIKQLRLQSGHLEARFRREARITARLQHPGIVPVYEAGRWPTGEPFYAMKLVSGRSLKAVIADARILDERIALLPHVIAVAEAMAFAHSQAIIHRDLKPANVMVGPFGETVVIDWGLAKELSQPDDDELPAAAAPAANDPTLTVAGAVIGTPAYMPPEQAVGEPVDARADVYALGAVLYHMLCGRDPYEGATSTEVVERVLREPPASLEAGVPADLVAIVHKAMARHRDQRYPTAREMAEDLRRFQAGQLVLAHRYSRGVLVRRWLARHRGPVGLGALSLATVIAIAVVSFQRVVRERNVADSERRAAQRANDVAEARRDQLTLAQARATVEKDPTAAVAWVKSYAAGRDPDWNDVRAVVEDARSRGVARDVLRGWRYPRRSRDGRWAAGIRDDGVAIWNVEQRAMRLLRAPGVQAISFSADGRAVYAADAVGIIALPVDGSASRRLFERAGVDRVYATVDTIITTVDDKALEIFELATGARRPLIGWSGGVHRLDSSHDGRTLAIVGEDQLLRLWEVATGRCLRVFPALPRPSSGAFSPTDDQLAIASFEGTVTVAALPDGPVRTFRGHTAHAVRAEISPDGRTLATTGEDTTVRLWDLVTGEGRVLKGHEDAVEDLAFSRDGKQLATGSQDLTVRLWDLASGESRVLRGHRGDILVVDFGDDGRLATATPEELRIWDPVPWPRAIRGHAALADVAVAGDTLASAVPNAHGRWDLASGTGHRVAGGNTFDRIALAPDGRTVAIPADGDAVRVFDGDSTRARIFHGPRTPMFAITFSADGRYLAACGADHGVWLWDVATGVGKRVAEQSASVYLVVFSPDGKTLASAGDDHPLYLWDLAKGEPRQIATPSGILDLRFSPDGSRVAVSNADNGLRVYDLATSVETRLSGHHAAVRQLAFSPDGALLATASDDRTVALWRVADGARVRTLRHDAPVRTVAFFPDGRHLVTSADDQAVRVWETASGGLQSTLRQAARLSTTVVERDGRWIVTVGDDRVIRAWPGAPARALGQPSRDWLAGVSSVEVGAEDEVATPIR